MYAYQRIGQPKLDQATPDQLAMVLERIGEGYSIKAAAHYAGISDVTVRRWRDRDPVFAQALTDARERGVETFEDEARRRSLDGVTKVKGVYYKGELVGEQTTTEYSDLLLMQRLNAYAPHLYKQTGAADGGPTVNVHVYLPPNQRDQAQPIDTTSPDLIDVPYEVETTQSLLPSTRETESDDREA